MARPKSILWVDDEVEGLAPHRRFLEDQGFTVAAAAHGDDALAMLRRQPYSVVLLDEQMPGRRGLELLGEIRAIDPAMPIVMVTQSEDEGTLRGATLAWREWVELVAELTRWEVRLAGAHEPGLSEALRTLQQSLRHDFSEFFRRHYPKWLANPEGDRPPLSVDVGAEFLIPVLPAPGGGGGG